MVVILQALPVGVELLQAVGVDILDSALALALISKFSNETRQARRAECRGPG